ncbi:MAG: four-carbon acid sugar kinase family protein [Lachnospiraceae bacterium]|nr:four-carbon acid sugar kinase family protein [Lachnospiraceae bacterium]
MAKHYLIIADDFTGANDTGVQMCRRGLLTSVIFAGKAIPEESGSVVIDTESRGMTPEEAAKVTAGAAKSVDFASYDYVIKKVDSTLRGNVAEESKAVDDAYGSELVIFAPALPALGRTTEGGIHKLNGVRLTETEIAKDPRKPVREDNLQKILQKVYQEAVTYVSLDQVRKKEFPFDAGRVFVFDAKTDVDLRTIISAAKKTGKKVLWIGTAAIADNIMELENPTLPALGIVASVSAVTNRQLHMAEENTTLVQIPVHHILDGSVTLKPYVDQVVEALGRGEDTILLSSSSYDRAEMDKSAEAGKKLGMEIWEVSAFVQKMMGQAALEILSRADVSGVFATGGDTAMGLMSYLESDGSTILSEITVGLPMMKLVGGKKDGLKVVTKAGAFGEEDAILFAFRKLKEKNFG